MTLRENPAEALLVVDVQTAFVTGPGAVPDADRLLDRTAALIARARASGALVVHATHDVPAAPGIAERVPGATVSRVAAWALSREADTTTPTSTVTFTATRPTAVAS
ncbi:isochorismatase family protein [Streptomyces sp. NPDC090127]|uniref:isochorismatase family protein n=1 Tax=Streptomyces sp. NPDC090127 TaxID=3365953 RepID=UPI0037FD7018